MSCRTIQIVARTSDDILYSFLSYADDRIFGLCVDEERFISLAEKFFNAFPFRRVDKDYFLIDKDKVKNIYENEREIGAPNYIAPYHYGMVFFDFKKKQIFSCNDYTPLNCIFGGSVMMDHIISTRHNKKIKGLNEESFQDEDFMAKNFFFIKKVEKKDYDVSDEEDIECYEKDYQAASIDNAYEMILLENLLLLKKDHVFTDNEKNEIDLRDVDLFDWLAENFVEKITSDSGREMSVLSLPNPFFCFYLKKKGWNFNYDISHVSDLPKLRSYLKKEEILKPNDELCWDIFEKRVENYHK